MPHVIVGLGNPGKEYEHTYHNVGLLALRHIAAAIENSGTPVAFKTHRGLFRYAAADDTVLVTPLVFMNESGQAVKEALKKFKALPEDLVVLHDESDVTLGSYKFSSDRNAAGHHGVESIMNNIHSKAFLRARIGIRPAHETARKKASEFVLADILAKDMQTLEEVFGKIAAKLLAKS